MGIKILHVVSGSVNDGASKGAIYLHKYLLEIGVDSKILFNSIDKEMENRISNIFYYKKNFYEKMIYYSYKLLFKILYNFIFFRNYKQIFTTGFYGVNIKKTFLFKEADIIHFHSINDFISLNTIKSIKKPIVWSLRDWWLMTGGLHTPEQLNFTKNNSNHFNHNKFHYKINNYIFSLLFQIKMNFVTTKKNIYFTAISDRIKNDFKYIYNKNKNINRIYNLTDQENFYPENLDFARSSLNIKTSKKIILFGAQRISDPSKGSQYLEKILAKLDPELYFIASFGINDRVNLSKFKFDYINFGEVNDNNILRKIYSMSNLFLCTSIHESFGKTVLESLLCSTPVVAFDIGAVNEIIFHRKNGYLIKPFNISDFIMGINYILKKENEWGSKKMLQYRLKFLEPFSNKIVPKLHLEQYNKIIKI